MILAAKQNAAVDFDALTLRPRVIYSDFSPWAHPVQPGFIRVDVPAEIYNESILNGHDPHRKVIAYAAARLPR